MRYPGYKENVEFFYSANESALEANYKRAGLPLSMLTEFYQDEAESVKYAKSDAEEYLSACNQLHTNMTEILDCFLTGTHSLYASLHIENPEYTFMYRWDPYGMHTIFRYGIEKVLMQIWFTRYRSSVKYKYNSRDYRDREYHIGYERIESFDFFGRLIWDADNKRIEAVPLFLTNIKMIK